MVVVFGPNLAVDRVLGVPGLRVGGVFRTGHTRVVVGGKGANVARALRALGEPVHLVGLVAGWTGRFIRESLAEEGLPATLVEAQGLSRTCTLLVDPEAGQATVVNEEGDLRLPAAELGRLEQMTASLAAEARALVCSGSLPPSVPADLYARIIRRARAAGVVTILDTSGPPLEQGVRAGPDLIKPNRAELGRLLASRGLREPGPAGGQPEPAADAGPGGGQAELARAALRLLQEGVGTVVVSLGAAGALAVTPEEAWLVQAPRVPVVNPIGAGDSMVAALAAGLSRGRRLPDLLRLAVAAGSADVATFGPGVISPDQVQRLLPQTTALRLPVPGGAAG